MYARGLTSPEKDKRGLAVALSSNWVSSARPELTINCPPATNWAECKSRVAALEERLERIDALVAEEAAEAEAGL